MAVLVQPFVPRAVANGVAITRNPFNEGRPAVFINVQVMGGSVTGARNDVPEQHLVYTYSEQLEDEILGTSTLTNGAPVMSTAEVERLTRILQSLHATLTPNYGASANAVDVEFLIAEAVGAGPRDIVIVQARPYRVVYTEGQRYRVL
jgi:rifampicin phosphotransferase